LNEMILFLAAPLAIAILLVGIHAYLGLHVLQRDVIFVDISLSQVAALGGAISLFFTDDENSLTAVSCSLGLCLIAAVALAFFRHFERKISQEAIIGITYALASGALILVLDGLPHGGEHLKSALVGNILFVTWPQVLKTACVYIAVGIVHFIFREKFWAVSRGQVRSVFWDFLFYFLFGVVITISTHHAGVLVVFSILVIPAALAIRFFDHLLGRMIFAWAFGLVSVLISFLVATHFDWPAGAAIVTTMATSFFIVLLGRMVYDKLR